MGYLVLLRGPLGVGKTAVAERLAHEVGAEQISIDRILDERGLWEAGRLSEFLRANEFAAERARKLLAEGVPVIVDGNFYWKLQIGDMVRRLDGPKYGFTLHAPLAVCIARDAHRHGSHGSRAAREVYAKTTRFDWGTGIDADRPLAAVVRDIRSYLPSAAGGKRRGRVGRAVRSAVRSSRVK